jgi:hypothetical protein
MFQLCQAAVPIFNGNLQYYNPERPSAWLISSRSGTEIVIRGSSA